MNAFPSLLVDKRLLYVTSFFHQVPSQAAQLERVYSSGVKASLSVPLQASILVVFDVSEVLSLRDTSQWQLLDKIVIPHITLGSRHFYDRVAASRAFRYSSTVST